MFVKLSKYKAEKQRADELEKKLQNMKKYCDYLYRQNQDIKLGIEIGRGENWYANQHKK